MIFAFDFPKIRKELNTDDPLHPTTILYENWPEKFNGLIDIQDDIPKYFGPAPPSLIDLLTNYKKKPQIMSSEEAISLSKPFYYILETQGPPEGWLGTQENYNNTLLSGVSKEILESTKKGKCTIILWSSNEGYDPFQYKIFDKIYEDLENFEIPKDKFIFISANLMINDLNRAWGSINDKNNLIKCIPFNNEKHDNYKLMQKNVIFDKYCNDKDNYFLLLNRAPRIHRMALVSWLHSRNLLDNTLTSFPSEELAPYNFSKKSHLSQYFSNMLSIDRNTKSSVLRSWSDLEKNHLPLIVDVEEWGTNHYGTSADWLYSKTFFSVVTESVYDDVSIFLDEKIWKPIYNYHPFIILGTPHCLRKLKELGFKTFHPFIDESYDEEINHGKRMSMIVDEIERLCKMDFEMLKDWYQNLSHILEYNKEHLHNDREDFDLLFRILN